MKRLFALLLLAALAVIPRVAADGLPLAISPVKQEITSRPGQVATAPITLKNNSNKLITVDISSRDFTASDNLNGEPKFTNEPNAKYGISNWFIDSNITRTLTIPGNQTVTYEAKFRVPASAVPRTYFGSVHFSSNNQNQNISVAGLVFITVSNPTTSLEIAEFNFEESDEASKQHGVFTATIKNTSEGLLTPDMRLKITDETGNNVAELKADTVGAILPESARIFSFTPLSELPKKNMTVTLSAVDQNGNTADKSIQVNLAPFVAEVKPPVDNQKRNGAYLFMGLVPIVVMLGVANRFMAHRKKQQITPELPPETPQPPTAPTDIM